MSPIAGDSVGEVQKDGGGMFVSSHGLAKGHVAQMLQRIGERKIPRIGGFPEMVASREFFGSESGQAEQIVRAMFNHVDAEIIAGIDAKVRAVSIAESQAIELNQTIEGRVFQAFDLRDFQQTEKSFRVEDFAVGSEHFA